MKEQTFSPQNIRVGRNFLKIAAIVTMVIDHIGYMFISYPQLYKLFRIVGRISFPIFCFLLVEGFLTTSNVKKYILRLSIFAIISEVPFDLAFFGSPFYIANQNVLFTLLIALLVLIGLKHFTLMPLIQIAVIAAGCALAMAVNCDYGIWGILLPAVFYIYKEKTASKYFWAMLLQFLQGGIQGYAVLAMPFILLYKPKQHEKRLPKYFGYAFYPAHLIVLYILSLLIQTLYF